MLPLTGLVNLALARLVTTAVGVEAFGPIMLIATLSQLLMFADLGAGAAVATAAAQLATAADGATRLHRTMLTSLRTLAGAALGLSLLAVAVALGGGWAPLLGLRAGALGSAHAIEWTAAAAVVIFSVVLPLSLGEAILRGTGRMHRAILLAGLSAPTALVLVLALTGLHGPHMLYALTIPAGAFVGSLACFVSARRAIAFSLRGIVHELLRPRRFPGLKISAIAGPWFVIMVGLPIALQTDRIVISHRVSAVALSNYSYISQLYTPIWSVVSIAALSLWPAFATGDVEPRALRHRWLTSVKLLGGAGLVLAAALVLLSRVIVNWTSDGNAHIGTGLVLCFAGLLLVQSLHVGTGMLLIAPDQLRFQAVCVCALVITTCRCPGCWPRRWARSGRSSRRSSRSPCARRCQAQCSHGEQPRAGRTRLPGRDNASRGGARGRSTRSTQPWHTSRRSSTRACPVTCWLRRRSGDERGLR